MPQSVTAAAAEAGPLSLRANFSWTLLGNVVFSACQWAILVVLAKLTSPEHVGQFALGLAITAPVMMFTNLQLRGVLATDAKAEYSFRSYLALRFLATAGAILVIAWIALSAGYDERTRWVVIVIGLAKGCEAMSDILYGWLQHHERLDRISVSMILKGPLSVAFVACATYLSGSIIWAAAGLLLATVITFFTYDVPSLRSVPSDERPLSWPAITEITMRTLPLGIVMMLISLNTNIPRYFIESSFGKRELGIFAAMAYVLVAGTTVVMALGQSASPQLARFFVQGNVEAFKRLQLRLVAVALALGAVGIFIIFAGGRPLLRLIYSPEYEPYADVFLLVMVASATNFVTSFVGFGLTAARAFKKQLIPFFAVTAVSVLCSWIFIPRFGLAGAGYTLIASQACGCILLTLALLGTLREVARSRSQAGE